MEIKQLGNIVDTGNFDNPQRGRIYDSNYISPTINTVPGGGLEVKTIVAMRGRDPKNPSNRSIGIQTEQRLEPNTQGVCNALTTVQKDNLVLESEIMDFCVGRLQDHQTPRADGISPSLTAAMGMGGGQTPLVGEKIRIKQATKDGYIDCDIGGVADLSFPSSATRRGRVQDGGNTCPTITASEMGICRIEKPVTTRGNDIAGTIRSSIYKQGERNIIKNCENGMGYEGIIEPTYRIRKLTPLECWRLMGFSDEDFHKAESVNSNSQLYKQAGNSIVKPVLMAIFKQMID